MGASGQSLNRMPHQRIRETVREPAVTPSTESDTASMDGIGYETDLDSLNAFARYVTI